VALPQTRWGSLQRSPGPLVGWGGEYILLIHYPLWRLRHQGSPSMPIWPPITWLWCPLYNTSPTQVSRYQEGKTNLDFTEARDSEWQWHQLGHMQVCTSLQTDNPISTPQLRNLNMKKVKCVNNNWHVSCPVSRWSVSDWQMTFGDI